MDYTKKVAELRDAKAKLVTQAETFLKENKFEDVKNINTQLDDLNTQIEVTENLAKESADRANDPNEKAKSAPVKLFNSLGEQLQTVRNAARGLVDSRLLKLNNSVQGGSEGVGPDGGFLVQEDFAGQILASAATAGEILSRVDPYTISAGSNAARWLMIDETDVSASVFGGVQMYWAAEGAAVGASKPKFREMKLDLEKMMGFAYATDELLADASFMTGFYGTAFTLACNRLLEDAIIRGDGVGKPLGVLNSPALITVAKDASQTADTVTATNLLNMWGRADIRNRKDAIWLMHPDVEGQLPSLALPYGSDKIPVWMPPGGIAGNPYDTIWNRPIVFNDQCSALGDAGDVMLLDLKQYMLLKKGTAKQDWSMHVEFLTDQMCFRIVFRVNGAPKVNKARTLKNSVNTRSPFVTIAARA